MLQLLLLVPLVIVIVKTAAGRGLSTWLIGSIAVLGFLLLQGLEAVLDQRLWHEPFYGKTVARGGARMATDIAVLSAPYLWLVVVYVYVRFVHGRGHAHAQSRWECPDCGWLNEASFTQCEACHREYREASPLERRGV